MKLQKVTCALLSILLLSAIFGAVHTIGGVSFAQAQEERFLFELTLQHSRSGLVTTMQVYAPDEEQARSSVVLNGWTVLSTKQLTLRESAPIDIDLPALTAEDYQLAETPPPPTNDDVVNGLIGDAPMANDRYEVPRLSQNAPENTLVDSIITSNEANAHVVIPPTPAPDERYTAKPDNATEAAQPSSYPATLPDKADLALLATVYFDLGVIEPTLSTEDTNFLATLDKTKKYYLYGHTDNVTVRPNALYKDNFELSRLRADKIMSILVGIGMNPASIKTTGLGTLYPVVANSSSTAGTAQNRRVEIYEDRTSGEI